MIPLIPANPLLAQSDPNNAGDETPRAKLDAISDSIVQGVEHDMPWELLLMGIGAILMTVVIVSIRRWWQSRHSDPSPMVLFSAIARKAGLGWRDRYLLWRISKAFNLPTPIALMLSKGTLRHYSDLYLRNAAGTSRRHSQRLTRIEDALFG